MEYFVLAQLRLIKFSWAEWNSPLYLRKVLHSEYRKLFYILMTNQWRLIGLHPCQLSSLVYPEVSCLKTLEQCNYHLFSSCILNKPGAMTRGAFASYLHPWKEQQFSLAFSLLCGPDFTWSILERPWTYSQTKAIRRKYILAQWSNQNVVNTNRWVYVREGVILEWITT